MLARTGESPPGELENHINQNAANTTEHDLVDDHVGGGDEDGVVDQKKKDGIGDLNMLSAKFGTGRMVDSRHPVVALPRTRLTSQA